MHIMFGMNSKRPAVPFYVAGIRAQRPHVPRPEPLISFLSSPELVKLLVYRPDDQSLPHMPSTRLSNTIHETTLSPQHSNSTGVDRSSRRKRFDRALSVLQSKASSLSRSAMLPSAMGSLSASDQTLHTGGPASAAPQQDTPAAPQQDAQAFYVHRDLLASRSPELHKHIYNDMKEGIEGVLVLHDVSETVVERFVTWVYSKEYSHSLPPGTPFGEMLMLDAQIYVFADRFNVQALKTYTLGKILLKLRQTYHRLERNLNSFVEPLVDIIAYSFDNLPTSGLLEPLPDAETPIFSDGGGDNLLRLWVQVVAWQLNMFRVLPAFDTLVENQDITRALFHRGVFRAASTAQVTNNPNTQFSPWGVDVPYQIFNPGMARQWGDASLAFDDHQLYGGGSDFVECGDEYSDKDADHDSTM